MPPLDQLASTVGGSTPAMDLSPGSRPWGTVGGLTGLGALYGTLMGAGAGVERKHPLQGAGRGLMRGAMTGAGAGLGAMTGSQLGGQLGPGTGALASLVGAGLGGAGGYFLGGDLLGEPTRDQEPIKQAALRDLAIRVGRRLAA